MSTKITTSMLFAAALAASTAHAGLLSFRSDDNHRAFTFTGNAGFITNAVQLDPYELLVDDHNGPLPPVVFQVRLLADFGLVPTGVVNVAGSTLHTYALNGGFSFVDFNTGAPLLTANVANGAVTSLGTGGAWGTSGNLQGNDTGRTSAVTYNWFGPDLAAYQIFTGQPSVGPDDFGFTLTSIISEFGTGVPIGQDSLPLTQWTSEGSFSATAYFVPSSGTAALFGLGMLAAARRSRQN